MSEDATTSDPVLHLAAVSVSLFVVHGQRRSVTTRTGVNDVRKRHHGSLQEVRGTQEGRIVQQLPVVLVEGVATTREALESKLDSHIRLVLEGSKLTRQTRRDTSSDTRGKHIVDSEVLLSVQVHSVLGRSALLVELEDEVVKL